MQSGENGSHSEKNQIGINALGWTGEWEEWQNIPIVIDSGAAETLIPHTAVVDHPIKETQASKAGVCYSSATDEPIPNLGEQKLPMVTQEPHSGR